MPIEDTFTNRKNVTTPPAFLEKLYDIMENVSLQPYISWQPDGLSFLIKDVQAVSEFVLPYYFKHNNIQSFVRQLNMYNFTKTRHDSNYREFRQPLFQKGRRDLLSDIRRKSQVPVEKSSALKRKYSVNDSEKEARYSLAISNVEIPVKATKCFWDGDEVRSRELDYYSGNHSSADDGIVGDVERKGELEEIISCMSNIESHIWFLSEQYVTLMESYKKMRGNIDSLQSSSLNNVVINSSEKERLKNALSPRHRTETASDACRSLLQITSGNPNDKDPRNKSSLHNCSHVADPCLPFAQSSGVLEKPNPLMSNKQQYFRLQLSVDDEGNRLETGRSGPNEMGQGHGQNQGQGLVAMAAAASLRCSHPNARPNEEPSIRSSLADLLDAASFR